MAIQETNLFRVELYNVPENTTSANLKIENTDILEWHVDHKKVVDGVNVIILIVKTKQIVPSDHLDGELSLSADNHDVQGADIYIFELEGTPNSLSYKEDSVAQSEGWGLFDADGEIQLQRIDDTAKFSSDDEAHAFVRKAVSENSEIHVKVKDILQAHSPDEYARIFES
jgi:hypothetical protein